MCRGHRNEFASAAIGQDEAASFRGHRCCCETGPTQTCEPLNCLLVSWDTMRDREMARMHPESAMGLLVCFTLWGLQQRAEWVQLPSGQRCCEAVLSSGRSAGSEALGKGATPKMPGEFCWHLASWISPKDDLRGLAIIFRHRLKNSWHLLTVSCFF